MISMKVILELQLIPHLFPQLSDCDRQFVTFIIFFFPSLTIGHIR